MPGLTFATQCHGHNCPTERGFSCQSNCIGSNNAVEMPLRNKRTNESSDGTTSLRTSFRKEWIATPSGVGPNRTIRRKHCYAPACEKDLKVQGYSRCEKVFGGGKRKGNEFYVNVTMHNF